MFWVARRKALEGACGTLISSSSSLHLDNQINIFFHHAPVWMCCLNTAPEQQVWPTMAGDLHICEPRQMFFLCKSLILGRNWQSSPWKETGKLGGSTEWRAAADPVLLQAKWLSSGQEQNGAKGLNFLISKSLKSSCGLLAGTILETVFLQSSHIGILQNSCVFTEGHSNWEGVDGAEETAKIWLVSIPVTLAKEGFRDTHTPAPLSAFVPLSFHCLRPAIT